jgi:hypothetical protein
MLGNVLWIGILAVSAVGSVADVSADFVNDYIPPSASSIPPRAIYRRGSDICLAAILAPSDQPNRSMSVTAGKYATFKTDGRDYTLELQSSATQSLAPPPGRRGQLKVVYSGLPDIVCAGTLTLPVRVKRGEAVVWEQVETRLFLVEARPFVPAVVDNLDVLAEAVRYASGQAGAMAIATAVTDGLFRSGRFIYDDTQSVSAFDTATGRVQLGTMRAGSKPLPVNCYQVSNYLGILLGSLGVESELREIVLDPDATREYAFRTAPIVSIGSATDKADSYKPLSMFSHQFLVAGGKVYDATYAPEHRPAGGRWARAVAGWTFAEYLGEKPGQNGGFVTGTPTGKRAVLRIERAEVPFVATSPQ